MPRMALPKYSRRLVQRGHGKQIVIAGTADFKRCPANYGN